MNNNDIPMTTTTSGLTLLIAINIDPPVFYDMKHIIL